MNDDDDQINEKPFTLADIRHRAAVRRQAEQSSDGRPSVNLYDDDPLLAALHREHSKQASKEDGQ
jgi:hypothetical protein